MWWWSLALGADPMVLQVVEAGSGDAIPCATPTAVHQVRLTTDDEGLAAFLEPGLMGQDVWFEPSAEGFRAQPDFSASSARPAEGATHVPTHLYPPDTGLDAGVNRCVEAGAELLLSAEAVGGEVGWSWNGGEADGLEVQLDLAPGDHVATATLTTPEGVTVEDRVLVHVDEAPDDVGDDTDTGVPADTTDTPSATPGPHAPNSEGCGCQAGAGSTGPMALLLLLLRRQPRHAERIDR